MMEMIENEDNLKKNSIKNNIFSNEIIKEEEEKEEADKNEIELKDINELSVEKPFLPQNNDDDQTKNYFESSPIKRLHKLLKRRKNNKSNDNTLNNQQSNIINNDNYDDLLPVNHFSNQNYILDHITRTYTYINKPRDSNISQQKLMAWTPMLTPKLVINLFAICSIIFLPIGIILYFNSDNVKLDNLIQIKFKF
jgi:hypothetical protein